MIRLTHFIFLLAPVMTWAQGIAPSGGVVGGSGQVGFIDGAGRVSGSPSFQYDGGQYVVLTGMGDGGIILDPGSAIFLAGDCVMPDCEYIKYSPLQGRMDIRTRGIDIGHGSTSGGGQLVTDGDTDFSAAMSSYVHLWSPGYTYYEIQALGNVDDVGIAIIPQANGNVYVGTTTDDGINKLQVNGSVAATGFHCTSSARCGAATMVSGTKPVTVVSGCLQYCIDVTNISRLTGCSVSGTTLTISASGASDVVNYFCF